MLFPLLSIFLGARAKGHCLRVPPFWSGAKSPTRTPTGLGWVKRKLPLTGNPTRGPLQPSPLSSSSWARPWASQGAQPPAAAPSLPGALAEDVQPGHRMRVTS